jgi:hypothetical protein
MTAGGWSLRHDAPSDEEHVQEAMPVREANLLRRRAVDLSFMCSSPALA